MILYAYGEHLKDMGPCGRLQQVGTVLLATEVMWLNEVLIEKFGVNAPALERLPLRLSALLDVATKAGLGVGRSRSAVLTELRKQSCLIKNQWLKENYVQQTSTTSANNDATGSSTNDTTVAEILADQVQRLNELTSVSHTRCI